MNRLIPIITILLLAVLLAAGSMRPSTRSADTSEKALNNFLLAVENHNLPAAFSFIAPSSNVDQTAFARDMFGREGSLKTLSSLQEFKIRVLRDTGAEAELRANMKWSTAIGAFDETRDFHLIKDGNEWRISYAVAAQPNLPTQVIAVNYLRWDVVHSNGSNDDWGAQNVEAPHIRITSMNATESDERVIVMGEVLNEDTVPGFVSIQAVLVDQNGKVFAEESSFDKIAHTLLPKEVSPFRIDFPGVKLSDVKNIRLTPNALLVPASADPVIGVIHQRIEKDATGKTVLSGQLVNQSGQLVQIPQVLATYYDGSGKVIWVSDAYVDKALEPGIPLGFKTELPDDLASKVQNYRVTVNHYTRESM